MAGSAALVKKKTDNLVKIVEDRKASLEMAMPEHMTWGRWVKSLQLALIQNPKIAECTPASVLKCAMSAAEAGLDFSSALGNAHLVPFGNNCQLIVGYRGLLDIARRSGAVTSIEARVVYEGDEFEYEHGLTPKLRHVPNPTAARDPKSILYAYAIAHMTDGSVQWDVMTKAEVDAIRKISRAGGSGPWRDHYAEMAKKTVLRRLWKYLPISAEDMRVVSQSDQAEFDFHNRSRRVQARITEIAEQLPLEESERVEEPSADDLNAELNDVDPDDCGSNSEEG